MTVLIMLPASINFRVSELGHISDVFNRPNIWYRNLFEFWVWVSFERDCRPVLVVDVII